MRSATDTTPQHTERLAVYWAEALGGPTTSSARYRDETSVVRIHSGNGPHEEMDQRAIACRRLSSYHSQHTRILHVPPVRTDSANAILIQLKFPAGLGCFSEADLPDYVAKNGKTSEARQ